MLIVFFFGSKRLGAQRWLELGYFNLQPSEFAKLFITLALIQYLTEHKVEKGIKNIVTAFFIMLFILLRGALPRPRYDLVMAAGWKFCLPLTLANLLITAAVVLLNQTPVGG